MGLAEFTQLTDINSSFTSSVQIIYTLVDTLYVSHYIFALHDAGKSSLTDHKSILVKMEAAVVWAGSTHKYQTATWL